MELSDREFFDPFAPSADNEWEAVPEYPEGALQRVLYETETRLSRLLRVEPGVSTADAVSHEYHEEVWIIKGGLVDRSLDEAFTSGMYAYRTPGMEHGPYDYPIGCLMFEHRYYESYTG